MSVEENFESTLAEISKVYSFLTEDEPSPDDEIEAREILLKLFKDLEELNTNDEIKNSISQIIQDLNKWDTLELWFSETSLPNQISKILRVPEPKIEDMPKISEEHMSTEQKPVEDGSEIDLTDIFNKVSEQFKGEIENLKGKIDDLKKELEKKDETLKQVTEKKQPQKIIPKIKTRLPPPKIKIPVIKKPIKPSKPKEEPKPIKDTPVTPESISEPITEPERETKPDLKPVELTPIKLEPTPHDLTPIPGKTEIPLLEEEPKELTPIPKNKTITPIVIEETQGEHVQDRPLITEKRVKTPVFVAEEKELEEEKKPAPFTIEKPKITSVSIEEIETETIQSTSADLFNVFSSVGKAKEHTEDFTDISMAEQIEVKKEEQKKNEAYIETPASNATSFVNFNNSGPQAEVEYQSTQVEDLSTDKDVLYQELIALEGRRYSLEKNFKDLERAYNKGSIADSEYKTQNIKLKSQLEEITSRINSIRRLISSL